MILQRRHWINKCTMRKYLEKGGKNVTREKHRSMKSLVKS